MSVHRDVGPPRYNTRSCPTADQPRLFHGAHYEALHLARSSIDYFSRPINNMTGPQQKALHKFQALQINKNSSLHKLANPNGSKALAPSDVLPMLQIFNDLFFFGAVKIQFAWESLPHEDAGCIVNNHLIKVNPTTSQKILRSCVKPMKVSEFRLLWRLGTMLHEMIHAYLGQFACTQCSTYDVNYGHAEYHGRAFHRIASAMERMFLEVFGMKPYISCRHDITSHWEDVRHLPSLHDMAEWKWLVEMRPHW